MTLKVLQLNINADNYWDRLTHFLTANDFDVIQLQEVAGKGTVGGNINSKRDCFSDLQDLLKDRYKGELVITERFTSSPTSYFGNATFYRKEFSLLEKKVLPLYKHEGPFPSDSKSFEGVGRALLHIKLDIATKQVSFLNAHFAWAKTPLEQPHQTKQGEILLKYLTTVRKPFIFSGDLNIRPDQPLIKKVSSIGQNLISKYNITNTLNPRKHLAKNLFPPGVAVDYVFISDDINIKKFEVLREDFSDHYGLAATIEI